MHMRQLRYNSNFVQKVPGSKVHTQQNKSMALLCVQAYQFLCESLQKGTLRLDLVYVQYY